MQRTLYLELLYYLKSFFFSPQDLLKKTEQNLRKRKRRKPVLFLSFMKKFKIILKNSVFLDEEHVHETKVIKLINYGSAKKKR